MSITSVLDGIASYFGGEYDPVTRTYRSSPVPGIGVVRRGIPTDDKTADYVNGLPAGARTGCVLLVAIPRQHERRVALGGEHSGMKLIVYDVLLRAFLRSNTPYAEEAQDDAYALRDALVAYMRRDRTLGGCVVQAGEHVTEAAGDGIDVEYSQPATKAGLTKGYFEVRFAAVEYIEA
ncbi:hypothetical protein ABTX35_03670 [Streptomyces sp. NPDC096080]|uniref:hypothetical protein n=1 Tax=Streptomyces sp. NPDC096080 TaxID=3156693 RepID=UPI00331B8DA8